MPEYHIEAREKTDLVLEIAHLLFIDVVSYTKLLVNEQIELMQQLNRVVRSTDCFREAEASGKLIRLPTGDGMVLLFFQSPEQPAQCALQISEALRDQGQIQLRMGIHSGPVNQVTDVNDQLNMAGAGINLGQRVMDCGDAGHILLSQHVAEDLTQYRHWQPYLHDLGECEAKHGLRLHLVNLYKDDLGNAAIPEKLRPGRRWKRTASGSVRRVSASPWPRILLVSALLLSAVALGVSFRIFSRHGLASLASNPPPLVSEKSIAVLPFENRSEEKSNQYFADGVQDEILTRLSKIGALKVIARTSTARYASKPPDLRQIAEELGVVNLLEGSVQKAGEEVRINVQLINARSNSTVWAESFDRKLTDIFSVESEVAKSIANRLQAKLTGLEEQVITARPTDNPQAYDAYLRAIEFDRRSGTAADLAQAIRNLERAVQLDPHFAIAWARLGKIRANVYYSDYDVTPTLHAAAREAVEKARDLAPDLGETYLALGYFQFYCERDLQSARLTLEEARKYLPNDSELLLALGRVAFHQGRAEDAVALQTEAAKIDPRSPLVFYGQARSLAKMRKFPEARLAVDRALALAPDDPELLSWKGNTYQAEGNLRSAAEILDLLPLDPMRENVVFSKIDNLIYRRRYREAIASLIPMLAQHNSPGDPRIAFYYALLGQIQMYAGDPVDARASFSKGRDLALAIIAKTGGPQGRIHAFLAWLYAGLGEKENALKEARRALELEGDDQDLAPSAEEIMARIEGQIGDRAHALELLSRLLQAQYFSWVSGGAPLTKALLRVDPAWDPIRSDPGFQKLMTGSQQ